MQQGTVEEEEEEEEFRPTTRPGTWWLQKAFGKSDAFLRAVSP